MTSSTAKLDREELDAAATRLEEIELEADNLRAQLREQVQQFGSIPPRAEKSRRLSTEHWELTVSSSTSTEVKDAEVLKIKDVCSADLFNQLFIEVRKFRLAPSALMGVAGVLPKDAPRNLRQMFTRAVVITEAEPRLRIKKLA